MKKILFFLILIIFSSLPVKADSEDKADFQPSINMNNFWNANGKPQEKVLDVGQKVINANRLDKRIPLMVEVDNKYVNAFSMRNPKVVVISTGLLPYLDNDDELAFIIGHEIGHALDFYVGPSRWAAMTFNSKSYEYKADQVGIDLMVKAGYNPIAAITGLNKFAPEPLFDFGFLTSHPKTSKRAFEMYKYIYKKYPWALNSDMVKNVSYQNYTFYAQKDINEFKQEEKYREDLRKNKYEL